MPSRKSEKYESRKQALETDQEIAYDFAIKAYKKFQSVIKSIALFGSAAKQTATRKSDIDIVIISKGELLEELGKSRRLYSPKNQEHFRTLPLDKFGFGELRRFLEKLE